MSEQLTAEERAAQAIEDFYEAGGSIFRGDHLERCIANAIRNAEAQARHAERRRWYEWCDQALTTWNGKMHEAMDYEEHDNEDIRQSAQRQRQFWEGATHALHCAMITNARNLAEALGDKLFNAIARGATTE